MIEDNGIQWPPARRLPGALQLWLAAACLAAVGESGAQARDAASCIATPAAYQEAFESCGPITCVSPNLYATIIVEPGSDPVTWQKTIYPSGFHWAWTSGADNLTKYSAWHQPVCANPSLGPAVSNRILLYVGFGQSFIDTVARGHPLNLEVMDLGKEPSLFVPTPAGWFQAFQREYGLSFPLGTQKGMALGYAGSPGRLTVPLDPSETFANITGCSRASAAQCFDAPLSQCNSPYRSMASLLQNYSPYGTPPNNTTARCVGAYTDKLAGREPNAAEARALLLYCQDVNPCNTGVGYGFNPAVPAPGGPPARHLTGPEFVLLNHALSSIGAVATELPVIP